MKDIWFSATSLVQDSGRVQYEPDQDTNVLVCAEQYQFKAPSGAQTVLGSYLDLNRTFQQVGFNAYQEAIAKHLILAINLASNFNTVTFLGPSALLASDNVFEFIGTTLPDDQWKREVEGWFQTSLARIQWFIIEWAAKSEDLGPYGYVAAPPQTTGNPVDEAEVDLCSRQRVRNTGAYQTFSFAGVMITVLVGLVFIIISWILDWTVSWVRRRAKSRHPWRETARIADNKLQLLRKDLVVSTANSDTYDDLEPRDPWDEIEDSMPVAQPGLKFFVPQQKAGDYHYSPLDVEGRSSEGQPDLEAVEPGPEPEPGSEPEPGYGEASESIPLRTPKLPAQATNSHSTLSSDSQRQDSGTSPCETRDQQQGFLGAGSILAG